MIEQIDSILKKAPLIRTLYGRNTARIKRETCMILQRLGILKPFTFVQWLATYGCNFSCSYCEASAGAPASNELTTSEALAMVDDLAAMGVKRLAVSGGEPLIRDDIIHIMSHAHDSGLNLGLVSNGYLVEQRWDDLRHFDYFLYFTSIDGLPEYHDRVRRRDSFARVMKSLDLFSRLQARSRIVNSVVHSQNIQQMASLFGLLRDSGATRWHLVPIMEVGRAEKDRSYALKGRQLRELADFIGNHSSRHFTVDFGEACTYLGCFSPEPVGNSFFCGAGLTRCAIMPDGEVIGCHTVYDNRFSEGNIREKPFSRIWKEDFGRFRQRRRIPEACIECLHWNACQGGCWSEMALKNKCLKSSWKTGS